MLLKVRYNSHPVAPAVPHSSPHQSVMGVSGGAGFHGQHCALGLFPAACYFNHSCAPNCCFHFDAELRCLEFRSTAAIAKGEEVAYSYSMAGAGLYEPTDQRRAALQEAFHFECKCRRCEPQVQPAGGGKGSSGKTGRATMAPSDRYITALASGEPDTSEEAVLGQAGVMHEAALRLFQEDKAAAHAAFRDFLGQPATRALHVCHRLRYTANLCLAVTSVATKDAEQQWKSGLVLMECMQRCCPFAVSEVCELQHLALTAMLQVLPPVGNGARSIDEANLQLMVTQTLKYADVLVALREMCFGAGHVVCTAARELRTRSKAAAAATGLAEN